MTEMSNRLSTLLPFLGVSYSTVIMLALLAADLTWVRRHQATCKQRVVPCSDFERLLVAMTHYLHQVRKRKEPLEEYLGEVMDFVYRKAGVLQEAAQQDDDGGP